MKTFGGLREGEAKPPDLANGIGGVPFRSSNNAIISQDLSSTLIFRSQLLNDEHFQRTLIHFHGNAATGHIYSIQTPGSTHFAMVWVSLALRIHCPTDIWQQTLYGL